MLSATNTLHAIRTPITAHLQQHRTIWQSHRHSRGTYNGINWVRTERKIRRRVTNPNPNPPHYQNQTPLENPDPWRSWSLRSRSGWAGFDKAGTKDFFEAERLRARQRMEEVKREVERDPYGVLFGRYGSYSSAMGMGMGLWGKRENTFTDLCRSLFGFEKSGGDTKNVNAKVKDADTTARVKSERSESNAGGARAKDAPSAKDNVAPVFEASQPQGFVETKASGLEFDPISGRMVPKPAASATTGESGAPSKDGTLNVPDSESNLEDDRLGFLSPTKSSGEATAVTSDPDIDGVQHKEPEQRANEVARPEDHGVNYDHTLWPSHEAPSTAKRTAIYEPEQGGIGSNWNHGLNAPYPSRETPSIAKSTAIDEAPTEITSAVSAPKNEDVSLQQPGAENSSLADTQQPKSLTPDAQPNEGRKMKGFFYVDKKEPEKLKIQDSPQQSEPFLVPENEELNLLRASDIRASYPSKELDIKSDAQSKKVDGTLEEVTPDENSVTESKPEPQDALGSVDERSTKAANYTGTQSSLQETEAPQSTQPQVQDEPQDSTKIIDHTPETHSPIKSASPATYRVLAYDPSIMQVTTADTDSSLAPSDEILRPSDVLSRLSNPAKFLPYFEEMRKEGYEIVSGGGDILVFKKFPESEKKPSDKPSLEAKEYEDMDMNPVDKYLVEKNALLWPPKSETEIPRKQRSAFNNAIRGMLFTGTAAAGTCYAFGVVTEYFRTGGSDGRGVDAFTVFESERRRRD